MCRHIYDWNIVNCDVKQPIHLTSPHGHLLHSLIEPISFYPNTGVKYPKLPVFHYLVFRIVVFLAWGRAPSPNQAYRFHVIHGVRKQWSHSPAGSWSPPDTFTLFSCCNKTSYCFSISEFTSYSKSITETINIWYKTGRALRLFTRSAK